MSAVAWAAAVLAAAAAALALAPARRPSEYSNPDSPGSTPSAQWWRLAAPLGAFAAGVAVLGGAVGVAFGAGAAWWLWRLLGGLETRTRRARRERLERIAPLVADLVADALSAGASPGPALAVAAEATGELVASELGPFVLRLDLGADPLSVWRPLAAHPQLGQIGRAFVRAAESGSSVTAAMRRTADDMRARERATREAAARSVSVKVAGPMGAFLLPSFVLVGIVPMVGSALVSFLG